ncbi:MAG: hypothetical protein IIZ18_02215, partial [Ruminococcus sp.]|nr:hypothetical protein [Ruminococcus sp.]
MGIFDKFKKKETETEYPLPRIVIALLGGSNSGKTAFFSGINQALVSDIVQLGNDTRLRMKAVSINRGTSSADNTTITREQPIEDEATVNDAFSVLSSSIGQGAGIPAAFGGASQPAPAAFGGAQPGGAPAAFGGAFGGGAQSAPKDDRSVNNIDLTGKQDVDYISGGSKLSAELDTNWKIDKAFKAGTATTKFIEVTFEVQVNGNPKCLLTITDYAGELIDRSNNVPDSMLTMLAKHISDSDAAIVLASARDMSKHIEDVYAADECMFMEQSTKDELSADRINNLMQYINNNDFTMLLAITQKDSPQVDRRVSVNNFARAAHDLMEHIYFPTFCRAKDMNWSYGVLPVSAIGTRKNGQPNVDQNNQLLPDANIRQENIDTSIIFCLYNAILAKEKELVPARDSLDKQFIKNKEDKQKLAEISDQCTKLNELRCAIMSDGNVFGSIYEPAMPLEKI